MDYPAGPNTITRVFTRGKRRQKRKNKRHVMIKTQPHTHQPGFADEAMSQEMHVASRSWRSKKADSPLETPEETQPCWHLDFSLLRSILNCDFQNWK